MNDANMTDMPIFRGYDKAALDKQYDPQAWAPNGEAEIKASQAKSKAARERLAGTYDIPYADHPAAKLDVYAPANASGAPVRVYFDGGGWLRGAKEGAAFAAALHVDAGAIFVAVNFAKLDTATIDEIVEQSRAAAVWTYRHIAEYGGDPAKLFISGKSSGGQQAAMVLGTDWPSYGLPMDTVKGAVIVSACYDLAPMAMTWRNDHLKLDADGVRRMSPVHHLPVFDADLVLAVAENDSAEIHRQMDVYADAYRAAGKSCTCYEVAGTTHFSINLALADPGAPLGRAQISQLGLR